MDVNSSLPRLESEHAQIMGPPGMPPPDDLTQLLNSVIWYLQIYYTPVMVSIGILFNIVSFAVLYCCHLSTLPVAHYLAAILIADTTHLFNLLLGWINNLGINIYEYGSLCHFTTFLEHASSFLIVWFTVAFSVDALIVVCFPYQRERFCTSARARVVVLGLAILATAVFLNISLTYAVVSIGTVFICVPATQFAEPRINLRKVDIFINIMIPYLGLLYIVIYVAVMMRTQYRHGRPTYTSSSRLRARTRSQEQFNTYPVRLFFVFVAFFFVFHLPHVSLRLYHELKHITGDPEAKMLPKDYLWQQIMGAVTNTRCSLNALVFFSTSASFRIGLPLLLKKCRRVKERGTVTSADGTFVAMAEGTTEETTETLIGATKTSV